MSLVNCVNLSIEFGGNYILKDVNCSVEYNSRIGLIGANGSGKSTLIKLILGQLTPTSGLVNKAKSLQIAYLAQNPLLDEEISLIDYVQQARGDILEMQKQMKELSGILDRTNDENCKEKLDRLIVRMHETDAFEYGNQLKYVLSSLAFEENVWQRPIYSFSGGEKTRITLAKILLSQYDLLVLDEPTNHLDIAMITWLEKYLNQLTKPFIVVSHDRIFLDNITRSIFSLKQGGLSITKGNYSSFYEAELIRNESQKKAYERQQKQIAETKSFIQKNLAGQKTKQAQSRRRQLEKLELIDKPLGDKSIKMRLMDSDRSGDDLYILKDVSIGFLKDKTLAKDISIAAYRGERISLIGPNGCGKTTLLKLLASEDEPLKGTIKRGASIKLGYYDQHQNTLNDELTVMETLWRLVPDTPKGYVLSWLARFGFTGDEVEKRVSVLSGGEKSRLYLSVLIHEKPNVLILDEPTNHLDIPMRDALLEALLDFEGSIIFVSHDRHFITALSTKFWVFKKVMEDELIHTTVVETDMEASRAIELSFEVPVIEKEAVDTRVRKKRVNPLHLKEISKKIEGLEKQVEEHKRRIAEIHHLLGQTETYNDREYMLKISAEEKEKEIEIKGLKEMISSLEDRYLELACDE